MISVHALRQPVSRMKVAAVEHKSAIEQKNRFSRAEVGEINAKLLQFSVTENLAAILARETRIHRRARLLVEKPEPRHRGVIHDTIVVGHSPAPRIDVFP